MHQPAALKDSTPAQASSRAATQRRDARLAEIEQALMATPGIIDQGRREMSRSKRLLREQGGR